MLPRPSTPSPDQDLFRNRLDNMIDPRHALCRLARLIDWSAIEAKFSPLYKDGKGCPGKSLRLMAGLQYLKHVHGMSDEKIARLWQENPYWQFFCGEEHFSHELPVDPSSMTRFRQRIGEAGGEFLLKATIATGLGSGAVKKRDLARVTVDTTVQPKAVAHPTDGGLLNRSRERLVRLAAKFGVPLRQSYARVGPRTLMRAGRYGHARQMKRMAGQVKKLRTILGRTVRDLERKLAGNAGLRAAFANELDMAKRLLAQRKHDKNKLYSLHAPETKCIAKGKARQRYEFGAKVSIATTNKSNFVVGGMAFHDNPYDGHTLAAALDQVRRLTETPIDEAFVDRGYRGHGEEEAAVYISGQRRGVNTRRLKKSLKRRQAVEPVIGHLKSDGHLGRNWLKGTEGDAMNVLLACAGHNLRLILNWIRFFCACLWALALGRWASGWPGGRAAG